MRFLNALTRLVVLVCIGSFFALSAAEAEWPQWRGPTRNARSPDQGLLKTWPAGGPALLWKTKGLGRGYSSVAVAQGKIFTMGDSTDASFIHALAAEGGKKLWSAKVGKPGGDYPGTRSTPTVDGARVYALGQFGDLVCVDTATGVEKWRKHLEKDFGGRMMSGWGYSESVLVDGDQVVCTPGGSRGTVVALDKETGALRWQSKELKDSAAYASIIAVEIGGVRQYIQLTDASVSGLAAKDGRLLWRAPRRGSTAVIPTPIYHDGFVYVTSGYGIGCDLFQ
ncbi:MAG: PQQ-binding-like beta-propeller repeat protein, partial [Verrucomicrobiota bacterium]